MLGQIGGEEIGEPVEIGLLGFECVEELGQAARQGDGLRRRARNLECQSFIGMSHRPFIDQADEQGFAFETRNRGRQEIIGGRSGRYLGYQQIFLDIADRADARQKHRVPSRRCEKGSLQAADSTARRQENGPARQIFQ